MRQYFDSTRNRRLIRLKFWWGRVLGFFLEVMFDNSVFQRMIGDDGESATNREGI